MNLDLIVSNARTRGALFQGDAASATDSRGVADLIILCAEEFQPGSDRVDPNARVLHAPNDDAELTPGQTHVAAMAAAVAARTFARGGRVLVTCMAGRNRSGLVTALAIHAYYGVGGKTAVRTVRTRRKGAAALTNPSFVRYLEGIFPDPNVVRARLVGLPCCGTLTSS